jgi:hypothetical protein
MDKSRNLIILSIHIIEDYGKSSPLRSVGWTQAAKAEQHWKQEMLALYAWMVYEQAMQHNSTMTTELRIHSVYEIDQ